MEVIPQTPTLARYLHISSVVGSPQTSIAWSQATNAIEAINSVWVSLLHQLLEIKWRGDRAYFDSFQHIYPVTKSCSRLDDA